MNRIAAFFLVLLIAAGARAAEWPSKPITLIVPYPAGSGSDSSSRLIAKAMSTLLKQPVVIDNRSGMAGNLGARVAVRAEPDGHTWLYSTQPMAMAMRMLSRPGYDLISDFEHVGRVVRSDLGIFVNASSRFRTLKDLTAAMKDEPGKLTFGTGGIGSPAQMVAELLLKDSETTALHVPYKGSNFSLTAVLAGEVNFTPSVITSAMPLVKEGRLRALAVTGATRNPYLPDVPTMRELGIKDLVVTSFTGLSLPKGTPAPIIERIRNVLAEVLADVSVQRQLADLGAFAAPSSAQEYIGELRGTVEMTETMMRLAKLTPQ